MRRFSQKPFTHAIALVTAGIFALTALTPPPCALAQGAAPAANGMEGLDLPAPGTMVGLSPVFNPPIVTGIKIYPENPLQFDFIIDIGDDQLQGEALQKESQKLINYFMATLTVPEDEMWVNLSPYEKDRIIAEGLSHTEMGRDMLAQDYLLKQLSASLMYPEDDFGKKFWDRVYSRAQAEYGTTEIPMNTFNKIWIVPDEAVVYVQDTNVFVVENHLKVMLEEDYLALESNVGSTKHGLGNVTKDDIEVISGVSAEIVRDILLPEIEKEVNQGKNFANLRQMYNSMLLATWYKKNLKESSLGQVYANQNKVSGIELDDKEIKQKIYDRYVEAFQKGVFNYIKEDVDSVTREVIPRKYFSGGLDDYLSEGGHSRFTETTGNVPESLVAKVERPHVIAIMKGQTLSNDRGSSPINNGATLSRIFHYPAGNFEVFMSSQNRNYTNTSGGAISIGLSMLYRGMLPEKEDYPAIIIAPQDDNWVGANGNNLMQIYFGIAANYFFHGRKTKIVISNDEQKDRIVRYLELGNPYYLPNEAGYGQALIDRFRREAIALADRTVVDGKPEIIAPEKHMVEFVYFSEDVAQIGDVTVKNNNDGTYQVTDSGNDVILDGRNLEEVKLEFQGVKPLSEIPEMGVTFLGTSGGMDPNGMTSNQIIWAAHKGILVDIGTTTLSSLNALNIEAQNLDYIVITHMHEDHVGGTLELFEWMKRSGKEIKLLVEPGIYKLFKEQMDLILNSDLEMNYDIRVIPMKFYEETSIGNDGVVVTPLPALHGTPTARLRVDYKGKTISHSSDGILDAPRLRSFSTLGLPGVPEAVIDDLVEMTDYERGEALLGVERAIELRDALFERNADGQKPELVIHEVGYGKKSEAGDLHNHTSAFDLDEALTPDDQKLIVGNHAAGLPAGVKFNFNIAAPLSTMTSAISPVGGIDFNPNNVNLTEQGDKLQIDFSATGLEALNPESINGILPVIINISPLPSVMPLLGLVE